MRTGRCNDHQATHSRSLNAAWVTGAEQFSLKVGKLMVVKSPPKSRIESCVSGQLGNSPETTVLKDLRGSRGGSTGTRPQAADLTSTQAFSRAILFVSTFFCIVHLGPPGIIATLPRQANIHRAHPTPPSLPPHPTPREGPGRGRQTAANQDNTKDR